MTVWMWGLVPVLAIAVYTDWRWHRLYNWLTMPAFLAGLMLSFVQGGGNGLLLSLEGAGVAFVVFLLLYLFAKMGAGDLKLMVAIGAWIGYPLILSALINVALAGGLIALAFAVRYGALKKVLRNLAYFMTGLFTPGVKSESLLAQSALPPFPYGVAIAVGTLLTLAFPHLLNAHGS